jgi:hypothetical protein
MAVLDLGNIRCRIESHSNQRYFKIELPNGDSEDTCIQFFMTMEDAMRISSYINVSIGGDASPTRLVDLMVEQNVLEATLGDARARIKAMEAEYQKVLEDGCGNAHGHCRCVSAMRRRVDELEGNSKCCTCGELVEEDRRRWAVPTCHGCLPPLVPLELNRRRST